MIQQEEQENNLSRALQLMQNQLDATSNKLQMTENDNMNLSAFNTKQDSNLVEFQLNLQEELDRIFHLLSGHVITRDSEGSEIWEEPKDDRLKIFSDYGVKQIMNIISFYVNRNTLLSNYDEETILWKVRDFGIELSDLIFNRYESFFYYPSPEELYEFYRPYVQSGEIKLSDYELYEKCIMWSNEELQSKIRHYPMMVLALIDTVHSTYLRALGGKERQTLRERVNISQNANQYSDNTFNPQPQRKFSMVRPSTW